jgi:1-acyl-sn-glycerol-3-phosphate acyltransferase
MQYMQFLRPIKAFNIEGLERAQSLGGCIFIANHPTLIDVVAVISCLPPCHCIVKKSLLEHFYLGRLMRAAGYIANDHANQLIQDCQRSLQAGRPILIFPEGTRSPAYGLNAFSRGAAQIALRTGAPVVPIVITCEPPTLLKDEPWYAVPPRPMTFTLRFLPPLTLPKTVTDKAGMPLQVRALTQYFEAFFRHQLHEMIDETTVPYLS